MSVARVGHDDALDVLIVTAVKDECDAVLSVDAGAVEGSAWEKRDASTGLELFVRAFEVEGGVLRIAVTRAFGMGREQAVMAAAPLLEQNPEIRCLAMCGVCAGRRDDVNLGDVIIADRTWPYDAGKQKATVDAEGKRIERFQGDMDLYRIHPPDWKHLADRFQTDPKAPWIVTRPRNYEAQSNWLLERLARGEDPVTHPDRKAKCPDYEPVLKQLWKVKWLEDGELVLTEAGRKHIRRLMNLQPDGLRDVEPFKVVVGPIASGAPVVEDPTIFDRLSDSSGMRKVIGLEMETSAILALAYLRKLPFAVVMKGVMDHADIFKSDNMKPFAACASAECLIAFLRKNLPFGTTNDPLDDHLVPGTSDPPAELNPAALLSARHAVVSFFGRDALLKEIHSWCDEPVPVRARLFYGAGGMGKTRLFIEACAQMRRQGWRAGFLRGGIEARQFEALLVTKRSTLAIIDYAESRPDLRDLLRIVAKLRAGKGRGRLRLVLLARNTGDWWTFLRSSDAEVGPLLGDHAPRELPPLVPSGPSRTAAFQEAAAQFARILERTPPAAAPTLDDLRYDSVLYIHMAALAAVEGHPFTAETLMGSTLDHEERYWLLRFPQDDMFDAQRFSEDMRRAVAALTLRGGASSRGEATEIVVRTAEEREDKLVDRRVRFLRVLYPWQRSVRGGSGYLSGLEPDLLGEAMVHRTLSLENGNATAYLDRVLDKADADAIRTAFVVLGRLSEHQPATAERWIEHVLGRDLASRAVAAFDAAKAVGERTAHARLGTVLAKALHRDGTIEIADRIREAGLPAHTVSLQEVAQWVEEKLLGHLREPSELEALAERARLLNNLGERLSALGQREAALASTQEAVTHFRKLAEQQPDEFLSYLAGSLNNLGSRLNDLGQREAALACTQEAVRHYRKLAEQRPDEFLPDLAMSLTTLGVILIELGQREAALASTQEAVTHYRKLAEQQLDAFLPHLATSLNNLGNMQSELGQREPALVSTQEAVAIRRKLAEQQPDAFLPGFAMSLTNLGGRQSELGQREMALRSTQEAVTHYRKLAEQRPDAFLPYLATSLSNLGNMQSELGQREPALRSTQEAMAHYRQLAEQWPDAFLPELAMCLNNLGNRQSELGQLEAALSSTQEAVAIRRKLAAQRPDAFLPYLAMSLSNLGGMQSALEQPEAALASVQEAVDIRRKLAEQLPDAFLPKLATSLSNLSAVHSALGQREAALASTQEAVTHFRKLAEHRPNEFLPDLAASLDSLGVRQSKQGQLEAALASTQEAVAIRRKLAEQLPDAFLPNLATSLSNLARRQSELGQLEAALASTQEAVTHYRKLAEQRPDAFLSGLAASLNNLGAMQLELGQREAALASTQETVTHYCKLAEQRPDAFLSGLAASVYNLGAMQSELGQREAALASTQEAVTHFRKLAEQVPAAFLPHLAARLNNLGAMQSELEQPEAALASIQEAVTCYRKLAEQLPDAFLPDLATSLDNLGAIQSELGQQELALASTQEAVAIRRKLSGPDVLE